MIRLMNRPMNPLPSQQRRRRAAMVLRMTLTAVAVTASLGASTGHAQQNSGPPNALQGFSSNRGKPVRIQAGSLEVRDKDKQAVFSGNVQVVQGDTTLRCKTLIVFYENDPSKPAIPIAQGKGEGQQQMRRMEAKGGVTVTQKDQVATGDSADYDVRANTITLKSNVVVTRGQDVLKGEKLVVNLTSGVSTVEAGVGRRVDMMISPRQDGNSGQGSGPLARPQR
jgi:lipopolysaccharide export system protein LptA